MDTTGHLLGMVQDAEERGYLLDNGLTGYDIAAIDAENYRRSGDAIGAQFCQAIAGDVTFRQVVRKWNAICVEPTN